MTFELFGKDARIEQKHQLGLLDASEVDEFDQFLKKRGMDVKLFKMLKDFGNKTAHVHRPRVSVKEIEAMVHEDSDYQAATEKKNRFIEALKQYKIIRVDGTVDLSVKPAFK